MMWFEVFKLADSKIVGFWNNRRDEYPEFPMPEPNNSNYDKAKMIEYLSYPYSAVVIKYRGVSHCRVCNAIIGSRTLSDGVYMYPEGLKHYVEEHEVELPSHFVNHVESNGYDPIKGWVDNHGMNEEQAKRLIELSNGPIGIYQVMEHMVRTGSNLEDEDFEGGLHPRDYPGR